MNFVLRPRLSLPSAWALPTRYPRPHPRGRMLLFYSKERQIYSQPAPENTHVTGNSFPPLPSTIPEPPTYPCPRLADFGMLKPLYRRHWKVCASHNNARETRTEALERKFTLTKYRHTLEFFKCNSAFAMFRTIGRSWTLNGSKIGLRPRGCWWNGWRPEFK